MLQKVLEPHAVLSVRLPIATYVAISERAQANGVRLSAEARELLTEAVQRGDQGDKQEVRR